MHCLNNGKIVTLMVVNLIPDNNNNSLIPVVNSLADLDTLMVFVQSKQIHLIHSKAIHRASKIKKKHIWLDSLIEVHLLLISARIMQWQMINAKLFNIQFIFMQIHYGENG